MSIKDEEQFEMKAKLKDGAEEVKNPYKDAARKGFYSPVFGENGTIKYMKPHYDKAGAYVRDFMHFVTDDGGTWELENNFYRPITRNRWKSILSKLTKGFGQPMHYRYFQLEIEAQTYISNLDLKDSKDKVNMQNGVLDLKTRLIEPHDSKYFFKYVLPYHYDPNAECPMFMEILEERFDGDKTTIKALGEYLGYCLEGGRQWLQKALVFHGEGENGKSTIIDIMKAMVGETACSNVPMKDIDKKFSVINMRGKLINHMEEITDGRVPTDMFKKITSSGMISGAFKGVDEVDFRADARQIIAANQHIKAYESTHGFERRLYLVALTKPLLKRNDDIYNIIINNELPGILNWALNRREALHARGELPKLRKQDDLMDNYRMENDVVFAFVHDYCDFDTNDGGVHKSEDIFQRFVLSCERMKRPYVSIHTFQKRFPRAVEIYFKAQKEDFKKHTENGTVYMNLRFRTESRPGVVRKDNVIWRPNDEPGVDPNAAR